MRHVTARYRIDGTCTAAAGLWQDSCIGAEVALDLTLATDTRTLLIGSGTAQATVALTKFTAPDGINGTAAVAPEYRGFGPVECRVSAGSIGFTVQLPGAEVAVTAYLLAEGTGIAYGRFEARIKGWCRRLLLRRLSGDFKGRLVAQEFSEGA